MTLEGLLDKITCPLLVVHGKNGRQVSIIHAKKTIEGAVNSLQRDLKIFTVADGGAEHSGVDNATLQIHYMADWVAKILGGYATGG